MQILNGLPLENDVVVANINLRTTIAPEEVLALLLSQEIRLQ